jgi:hypothetical protein
LAVPHDVVASAQEHEVADVGAAAVGSGAQVVDVAEGGGSAAAFRDAAAVAGSDSTALGGADLVCDDGQADALAVLVEDDPFELRVTEQGVDLGSGGRSGPGGGGAVRAGMLVEVNKEPR